MFTNALRLCLYSNDVGCSARKLHWNIPLYNLSLLMNGIIIHEKQHNLYFKVDENLNEKFTKELHKFSHFQSISIPDRNSNLSVCPEVFFRLFRVLYMRKCLKTTGPDTHANYYCSEFSAKLAAIYIVTPTINSCTCPQPFPATSSAVYESDIKLTHSI